MQDGMGGSRRWLCTLIQGAMVQHMCYQQQPLADGSEAVGYQAGLEGALWLGGFAGLTRAVGQLGKAMVPD
jgi:hypothetical protein